MKVFIFILVGSLILCGCNARHTIKIGGEYDGVIGDIEYTWDPIKSKEAGYPVLSSPKGDRVLLTPAALGVQGLLGVKTLNKK